MSSLRLGVPMSRNTKDLILWRHAHAELLQPGQTDLDRQLTPRGQRQAKAMGEWLRSRLDPAASIWVSPAQRTQQTIAPLSRAFSTQPGISPDASLNQVLSLIDSAEPQSPLLLVGHQPLLGQIAASLLSGQPQPWSVKKGSIWWLRHRQRDNESAAWTLKLVIAAEDLPL